MIKNIVLAHVMALRSIDQVGKKKRTGAFFQYPEMFVEQANFLLNHFE